LEIDGFYVEQPKRKWVRMRMWKIPIRFVWNGIEGSRCDGTATGRDACAWGTGFSCKCGGMPTLRLRSVQAPRHGYNRMDPGFWLKCVPLYGRKVVNEYLKYRRSA
jgi:hypothetical protein